MADSSKMSPLFLQFLTITFVSIALCSKKILAYLKITIYICTKQKMRNRRFRNGGFAF